MPKRSRRPEPDPNLLGKSIVDSLTKQEPPDEGKAPAKPSKSEISRVMAAMGRKGGKKGGKRRLVTMTPEERRAVAFKAAKARWSKVRRAGGKRKKVE